MNKDIRPKIIEVCNIIEVCKNKISAKGDNMALSFYVFVITVYNSPERLMEVARWWILENKLDQFEKL